MKTVLVIDDDAPFRKQAYRGLPGAGWRPLKAAGAWLVKPISRVG